MFRKFVANRIRSTPAFQQQHYELVNLPASFSITFQMNGRLLDRNWDSFAADKTTFRNRHDCWSRSAGTTEKLWFWMTHHAQACVPIPSYLLELPPDAFLEPSLTDGFASKCGLTCSKHIVVYVHSRDPATWLLISSFIGYKLPILIWGRWRIALSVR